jgi:His/Glu/Gln/Arg/opine family amino acid ABC transporter permease subunit
MNGLDLTALLPGALATIKIAGGAWLLALVIGMLMSYVRETGFRPLLWLVNGFTTLIRSIPELVMLYLVYFGIAYLGVRLDSLTAAIVALGVAESAFMAEYFRASLNTVTSSQRQAGLSLGLSQVKVLRLIVLPQAVPFAVPPLLNSFVGLLKTATLASAVGAVELLYAGQDLMNRTGQVLPVAISLVVIYVVATLPLTALVGKLEYRARARASRA